MPTENPTDTTIEIKFRGDGGEPYSGPERRDQRRDKNWDDRLCPERVLAQVKRPALTAFADGKPFALNFKQQELSAEGDSRDFRRRVIKGTCNSVGFSVSRAMETVYLEAIQPR